MGYPDWQTPVAWLLPYQRKYKFSQDVCGSATDPIRELIPRYLDKETDGLSVDWLGLRVFCNPPYDRDLHKWVEKAAEGRAEVAMLLLPPSVDAGWFQDWIYDPVIRDWPKPHYWFPRGRIKFWREGKPGPSPRAGNLVVVW